MFLQEKFLPDLGFADLFPSYSTAHCGSVVGSPGSVAPSDLPGFVVLFDLPGSAIPSDLPGSVVLFDLSLAASDYRLPSFVDSLPPGDRSDDSEVIFISKNNKDFEDIEAG